MTENKSIQRQIREHFSYLMTDDGFSDDLSVSTDDSYPEVRFKKNDWAISIVTTAHGTKISLNLISPTGDFGFLSHYFKTIETDYNKTEGKTKNLMDNIRFHSDFLRTNGKDILIADTKRLTEILEFIKSEQMKWIQPLMKRHSDK
jgi:hypothetical protein